MTEPERHLLLVEDEAPLREATAERLVEHGYRVTEAESGEAARDLLADFAFDVVITDLRLPGIDGAKVVEIALERYPEIIAVVVTGYGTVEDAVAAIKHGATDFVMKPFPFDHLLHILSTALETAAAEVRERVPPATAPGALSVRGHRGTQSSDAGSLPAPRDRGRNAEHDSHHG